jgi:hypothetical protein
VRAAEPEPRTTMSQVWRRGSLVSGMLSTLIGLFADASFVDDDGGGGLV